MKTENENAKTLQCSSQRHKSMQALIYDLESK